MQFPLLISSSGRLPSVIGFIFMWLNFSVLGQEAPADSESKWAHEASDIPADPSLHFGELPNGFRYVIMPHNEPPERVSLRLYVDVGSLMESEEERGLAHFLEHMAFNGTKRFPGGEIVTFLQKLGMAFGPDINAHTSFDETVYKLDLPNTDEATLGKGMEILRDWADGMLLADEEIDLERGVILREKLGRDSVQFRMLEAEFDFLMPNSLLPKRMPIGVESVIKEAPKETFRGFYERYYTPNRMVMVVVGDIDAEAMEASIRETFGSMEAPEVAVPDPDLGSVSGQGLQVKLHRESEAPATQVSLSSLKPYQPKPDTQANRMSEMPLQLANRMFNRRLEILAKDPEAPFAGGGAFADELFQFVDLAGIELQCQPDQWEAALALAEQEMRRIIQYGFSEAELAEATADIIRAYEQAVETAPSRKSSDLANAIVSSLGADEVFSSPERDLRIIREGFASIATDECQQAFAERWQTDDLNIMISGDLPEGIEDSAIADVYHKSREETLTARIEGEQQEFAYETFGAKGQIASREEVTDLGITQLVFENGVRVNLKPTDFQKNTILLTSRFGGGKLSMPLDKPGLDLMASATFDSAGLEAHSADDLQRLFAGKNVDTAFSVDADSFRLSGKTTPADLRNQLNLMCAHFIAAGYRPEAENELRKMVPIIFSQLRTTPEGMVQKEVERFIHGGDARFGIPDEAELLKRNLSEVREWVDPALKSAALEISLVGDFKVEAVIDPLLETFGALGSRKELESFQSEGQVSFPDDVREKTYIFESKIPKALSMVYWPTTDRPSDINRSRRMSALASVLSERLRVTIREELGEAYSPYAHSDMSDAFPDYGVLMAMSPGSPDKAEEVAQRVVELGQQLATEGTNADELERVLNPLKTSLEQQKRNNSYWLNSVLAQSQESPERLDWARSLESDFAEITVEDINELAAKYLPAERSLKVVISAVSSPGASDPEIPGEGTNE